MKLFKKNESNNKIEVINFFNKPYRSYIKKELTNRVNLLFSELNELIGTLSELDPLSNDGVMMELYFADMLDKNNLHYQHVSQELSFISSLIALKSQRVDFVISNNHNHYFIDVKHYNRYKNGCFTLNPDHMKHYSYFNTNIGKLYLVFFDKAKTTHDTCFILEWQLLEQYLKVNKLPSYYKFYSLPNQLLQEVKLNELGSYFS